MTRRLPLAPSFSGSVALALTLLALVTGCGHKTEVIAVPEIVYGLAAAQATQQAVPLGTATVGTVHATESAILSAQVTGQVISVLVREGDAVSAGQTLVKLDDSQSQAEVNRATANLAASRHTVELAQSDSGLADSTLARYQILRDRKSVSAQEFDQIEHRAQATKAQLDAAKAQLSASEAGEASLRAVASYSRIAAPFSGRVTARLVDPGTVAAPGVPLLQMDKAGSLELHVTADETLLSAIHLKMPVPVRIGPETSPPITGTVATILPAADPTSHTFVVKIALPASRDFRAGMYGSAIIDNGTRPAILIPSSALVTHGSLHSVWVLDAHQLASLRYVTLGAQHNNSIEVLSGIGAGETVVLSPGDRELGGKRIEVSR